MVREEKPRTVYWLENTLYLNITNKCSNKCIFCFKNFKKGIRDFTLILNEEPSYEQIILELEKAMRMKTWKEVVFCGFGEPTERMSLLLEVSKWIKQHYHESVAIRVNTNGQGYILNSGRDIIQEFRHAGIGKVSVSLNAANEETYNEICKPAFPGAYAAVLEFIKKAKDKLDVEVTIVTIPEISLHEVENLARSLGVKYRSRQYVPCFW